MSEMLRKFQAEMEAIIKAGQEQVNANQDEVKAAMGPGQEKMEAVINFIWSELEDTISNQVEGVLASFDQTIQSLCQKLSRDKKEPPRGAQHSD
jgi:hypothetical protein